MALSDYMPYGAPELLEGASPRLARSTLVASGLVATLVFGLGILAASRPVMRELDPGSFPPSIFEPLVYEPQPPPGPAPAIPRFKAVDGDYRPVVEAPPVLPSIEDPGPIGPASSDQRGEPEMVRGGPAPDPSPDPPPDAFVYTDELPQLVRGVKPEYPDLAREAGVEGTVKLQLLVGLDGHVVRAIVRAGGSVPMLDEAAIAAALRTVFTPALANGRPVKVWVTQDYRFTLH